MSGLVVAISDPQNGTTALIDKDRAVLVDQKRIPTIPFSQYFTNDGTASGSEEMAITTGTLAAPVNFYIKASADYDILITKLKFFISGAAANLNEFGTGTALTNGCRIYFTAPILGEVQLNPVIKSNYDLVRLADGSPAFGDATTVYQITNAIGTAEAFHPVMFLERMMPNGKGIFLEKNSRQRLVIAIRDNTLTSRAVNFNCIADGEQFL